MSYAAKSVPAAQDREAEGNNPLATVSLILGIVGLVSGGCPFSLAATITGWMGMKRESQGTAKIGFWLGVAGMVLQALLGLLMLLFFGAALGIGLTTVEMQPAPTSHVAPMAPPEILEAMPAPMIEAPAPELEAAPGEPMEEESAFDPETDAIQPPVEEVPDAAP